MTQALEQRIYTPDEYLELELASETRNETAMARLFL
jgi:hypothetical protein